MSSSYLPENPFDSQVFIDVFGVQWEFDSSVQCWRRIGAQNEIPLATSTTIGLLSKEDKFLIDSVQEKGGGYGIIIRGLKLRSQSNPDGILLGDVELVSHSLNIQCRDQEGKEITPSCSNVIFREKDTVPPGFDINLSDAFLKSFCVEIAGGPGQIGLPGDNGDKGDDGTGDGPIGLQGTPGIDYTTAHTFTGVKIVDIDQMTDTAVVALEVNREQGKLFVTKSKINFPTGDDLVAEQLIASQLSRSIKFKGDCWDYDFVVSPCGPADNYDIDNPLVAYYPSNFDPTKEINSYTPVRARLSDIIADMIAVYQAKLDAAVNGYDEKIRTFMKEKDSQARQVLSFLGDRLAECENITYLDYCIGLQQGCDNAASSDIVVVDETDPLCASLGSFLSCTGTDGLPRATCQIIGCFEIYNKGAPVFSFIAPDPFISAATDDSDNVQTSVSRICESQCWLLYDTHSNAAGIAARGTIIPPKSVTYPALPVSAGVNSYMNSSPPVMVPNSLTPGQTAILADEFNVWATDLAARLNDGYLLREKTQLTYQGSYEFPAGSYVFIYQDGGVRQERLNINERFDEPPNSDMFQTEGPFNDYFVGNEGGGSLGPFFILNPYDHSKRVQINNNIASTEIGLEIGSAPTTYQNLSSKYFASHAFNPYEFYGAGATDTPLSYVDPIGLDISAIANENLINWEQFPATNGSVSRCELTDLEQYYQTGSLDLKVLHINLTQPSFLFARIKTAYTITNFFGNLIMPPILDPSIEPGLIKDYSYNRAIIYRNVNNAWPVINARPIATGKINIKVVKVDCPESQV